MSFNNLASRHLSEQEIAEITTLYAQLEAILTPKLASLSPDERTQYGSINEQNKLVVNKIRDFRDADPALSSPDVDWTEFEDDYRTRGFLEKFINKLARLKDGLTNAKILHDSDNYKAALLDYNYAKYKNSASVPGYETKIREVQQFFSRTGTRRTTNTEEENTVNDSTTIE